MDDYDLFGARLSQALIECAKVDNLLDMEHFFHRTVAAWHKVLGLFSM
jgi:hypothetical protein